MYKNAKYELTDTNERPLGSNVRLYRLKALRDIGSDVKAGDLGGLIGGPGTLSEWDECWVYPQAIAYGGATIWDNAKLRDRARIHGGVKLEGNCIVGGNAQILANLCMGGSAYLEDAQVVSLMVTAAGQYTSSGETYFCFDCELTDRNTVRLEISSRRCTPEAAADLALTPAGSRLSYVMYKGQLHPLDAVQFDAIGFPLVEHQLESIDNGTYWRAHLLDNVIKMT